MSFRIDAGIRSRGSVAVSESMATFNGLALLNLLATLHTTKEQA
jgi:hypothetical protein